jgi:hypothetical protein
MLGGGTGSKGSSWRDEVARGGVALFLYRDSGNAGDRSSSCAVRSNAPCAGPKGVMGDVCRDVLGMQFVGEFAPLSVDTVGSMGDGLFPPSKLSPRLKSFSKLPLIRAPVLRLLSLLP